MSKQLDFTAGLGFEWLCRIPVFPRFCIMTFAYGKGDLQKSFDFRGKQFFFFFFFFLIDLQSCEFVRMISPFLFSVCCFLH